MSAKQSKILETQEYDVLMRIEIPFGSNIKYEFDEQNRLIVDRVLHTPMNYPFNYGYIPDTLAGDGDPLDAALITETPLFPGSYVKARIVGALVTEDEKGLDEKVIMVPIESVDPRFKEIQNISDISQQFLEQIKFFFDNYKRLERGKFIKIGDYLDRDQTLKIYRESIERKALASRKITDETERKDDEENLVREKVKKQKRSYQENINRHNMQVNRQLAQQQEQEWNELRLLANNDSERESLRHMHNRRWGHEWR